MSEMRRTGFYHTITHHMEIDIPIGMGSIHAADYASAPVKINGSPTENVVDEAG
jgi:hypothetical protein